MKDKPGIALRTRSVITLFIVLVSCVLPAQPGTSSFVHYTSDQGLSNDYIQDIIKDGPGFLWIATQNGLNRFDGHNFRSFFADPDQPNGLPDNLVRTLTLGPDGHIWATGNKGIFRVDPVSLEIQRFLLPENLDSLDNDPVGRVVFDPSGQGWVCGEKSIYSFDPETGKTVSYPIYRDYGGYFDTYLDRSNRLWLINQDTVSRFDLQTKQLRTYDTERPGHPLKGAAFLHVREDQEGRIWISSWFKGLCQYLPAQDSIIDFPDQGNTLALAIQPDHTLSGEPFLWVGGGNNGLFVFFPETGEGIQYPPDLRDPYSHNNYLANSFYKDDDTGDVWIGTEAGLEHYAPSTLRFNRVILPVDNRFGQFSLMSGAVQDLSDPSGNTYYIAMWGSGFFKWNRKNNALVQFHDQNSGLKNNGILCAMQDREGYLWAGTDGVSRMDPRHGTWRYWETYSTRLQETVRVMTCLEDLDGRKWFGTNKGGLFSYNPDTDRMEEVPLPAELYSADGKLRINSMGLDKAGKIWIATNRQPVLFDPRTRKASLYTVRHVTRDYNQWADVLVARTGLLYVTSHDCLLELDTMCNVLRQFNLKNGLRSNRVYKVAEDRQGRIWFNTTHLLHCLDPATGAFSYYGTADGLFKNTVTDGLNMTPGGELFVGFQNAFNYVNPDKLRLNFTPPPVVITSTKVMNSERKLVIRESFRFRWMFNHGERRIHDTMLVIQPGEDIFTIEFAALNFNQPQRNRYAYQLEGFNADWVYTDLNFVTYTNLGKGDYVFRVKAANNDGVWNETGARILVRVIPPWSGRWYFQLGMAGVLGLILLSIYYYRLHQRRRLEAFRESLARDLHDEMGSTLSSIRFFSEFARQQTEADLPQVTAILQRISQSASDLSESMQDIIWAMKRRNDQLDDLAARMTEFGLRLLESRDITFRTHIGPDFSGKSLSPEVKRNLYLIFKEAVNNAAKYAEATEVELFLAYRKGLLLMKLSDNGKGFDADSCLQRQEGNGLQNMRKRAEEIGGKLEIQAAEGAGTSIELRVRL